MSSDSPSNVEEMQVSCCIAGGGPAGLMLGLLLARAGVEVIVLEKHVDFLRDFRGDTIHPSTLEIMYELGMLEEFLKRPHQEVRQLSGQVGDETVILADFSHMPTHCKFIALMPQWDFLNFVTEEASRYPTFKLRMEAEVTGLQESDGRIIGVVAETPTGSLQIKADLIVGADGRQSVVRSQAGLPSESFGSPIDVLWFRLSRQSQDQNQPLGRIVDGKVMVMLNRDEYWQCAFVIPKGEFEKVRGRGLASFREDLVRIAPFTNDRVQELSDWNDIKLLTVLIDRLREWSRPGVLCIGDAAHAMSPIGGVGINLAIQDAVAAANNLYEPLRQGTLSDNDLKKVQSRRELPTRATQRMQLIIQSQVFGRVLGQRDIRLPWGLRLFEKFPSLRRIPARLVGIGFRPEHVKTPDAFLSVR